MKKICLTLLTCTSLCAFLVAQEWDNGVNYVAWIANSETGKVYANTAVIATICYQDSDSNNLYCEEHTGNTNSLGNFSFKIGKGVPISGILSKETFKVARSLHYNYDVDIQGGQRDIIIGSVGICASPLAHIASCALKSDDSDRFGGIGWATGPKPSILEVLSPAIDRSYKVMTVEYTDGPSELTVVSNIRLTDLIRSKETVEVNSLLTRKYFSVGTSIGYPMWCGPDPDVIDCMHGIRMPTLGNLNYGVNLRVDNYNADHHTYALLTRNDNSTGGGILTTSASRGIVAVAPSAGEFQTVGTANGFGAYGLVINAPNTGGYKYALAGTDGGFAEGYAAILFGKSGATQAMMIFSDARLKREIKSESKSLSLINKLNPSTYFFNDDLPYHFPKGKQHGFVAQEVESVFPELVSEITVPLSLDPDKMANGEVTRYKAVNYEGLIPVLTGAIQELDAKVISQQSEIDEMKQIIQQFQTRLDALEK